MTGSKNGYKISDTIITIPSINRAHRVCTHKLFPKDVINWMYIVPEDQLADYADAVGYTHVLALDNDIPQRIGDQRQGIMELFTQGGFKYVWQMDDDMTYLYRTEGVKLKKCEAPQIEEMFYYMREQADEVPYVGIGPRFGNNTIGEYADITAVRRSFLVDTEMFANLGAVYNPIPDFIGEDTHMSICVLNAGHKTRVIGKYAYTEDTGADGGCSGYRDAELVKKTTYWMSEHHPEVTVKVKFSKTKWGLDESKDGRKFRVDYNVKWKQAYKPKKVRSGGGLAARLAKRTS